MRFRHIATFAACVSIWTGLLAALSCTSAKAVETGCATLVGAHAPGSSQGFQVRNGEPVDLVGSGKTVHGKLLVFGDNGVFRAYWQAENSPEKYVLANAGVDTVRLVSTPPQGTPVQNGEPGTTLAPQRVLSCPAL
ncbi:hypothetical protein [Paraburkholderia sp. BCC1884]|uniref:hypothetical protein n=1 Tax=Paraburkholderia sp. BCC1884 TaxID=2562668 RepID=UPI0011840FC7|nr:hypothetical protein [Paraburkholderia sp. BCC1884]